MHKQYLEKKTFLVVVLFVYYDFCPIEKKHPGCLHLIWTLATPVVSSKRLTPPNEKESQKKLCFKLYKHDATVGRIRAKF